MATPGAKDDVTITVGAENNEAQFREVLAQIEHGFEQVTAKIISQLGAEFARFAQTAGKNFDTVQPKIRKAAQELSDMGTAGENAFKGIDRQLANLLTVLTQFNRSASEGVGAMATIREGNRRLSVETTARSQDVARKQIEDTRAASHAHTVETQRITTEERSAALERIQFAKNEGRQSAIAAQRAAAQRVLITQSALQTIGRLEKGLGATISGAARVASSAFSKIFDHFGSGRGGGIAGAVARQNSELTGELGRTESIVSTKTREINNSFTEGTNSALNKRERLIRDSFREQETVVRQSVVRQEAAIEGLRKTTQTGVLGAANRGLNIGAFLGGAAIFTAVRSTFSVGSEFVRGLAVLQSSLDLTAAQMKDVRKLAIDLGNDITLPGVSALDAAQAIQILTKQFGSLGAGAVDAAEKAAKGTLQLSRAANVSAEDAAGIIGAAVNVFKIGADQAVAVADNVAGALAKAAGVSFTDFRDAFVQGATVFEQFVGPVESANNVLLDFNTTLAILAKNGITGSTAGAGLKQFFLQANKSGPKAAKLSKELAGKVGETGNLFFTASGKARQYDDSLRILRKSLQGLTDQQRTSTLSTLFGSKSITIANALINTSQKDYDELRKSIQKQGLAAKIAAAQNTGFAGALDALKSVVETAQILLFEKLNPILHDVTLAFATFLNSILSGKGVWEVIRRGLLGIAAGLGAVLAVKGVLEVFGALRDLLVVIATPMGAVVVAIAAIGAAISILLDISPPFRKAFENLKVLFEEFATILFIRVHSALKTLGTIIQFTVLPFLENLVLIVGGKVLDAFHFVSGFIIVTVIPALKKLADFVERNAVKGWGILVRFFEDRVIPAFKLIVQFVEKSILPKLKELAGFVGHELVDAFKILTDFLTGSVYPAIFGIGLAFGPTGVIIAAAASAIIFFWDSVRPVLQPAIDGFKTLGDAVSTAFKLGDLSGVGAGLSAAGSGIAKVASTIGGLIVDVLKAAGRSLVAGLKEVFSVAHLIAAGKGFLDFVEFVGHTLGAIVTNPKFVAAVGAIGIALATGAGLVAFRFLKGFGEAFLHNLPALVKLLGRTLLAALSGALLFALHNPALATIIAAGLIALFEARSLFRAISAAGEKAGGGFLRGFAQTAKVTAGSSLLRFKAIFDGDAFTKFAKEQGFKAGKAMVKEFGANNNILRAAGQAPVGAGFFISEKQSKEAAERVKKVKDSLGQVGTAALLARADSLALTTVLKGIGSAIGGIKGNFDKNRGAGDTFFNSIKFAFGKAIENMKRTALLSGADIGKTLGKAVAGAALAAVTAIGAFQGGKAEGASGGSGLLSALIGGVTTTAVLGGPENPLAVAAGVATVGIGLLGAAMGRAERNAKAFKEAVGNLSKSFTNDLTNAIKDGTVVVNDFATVHIDPSAVLTAGDNLKQATSQIADALSPDQVQQITDQLGRGGLNKVSQLLLDAGGDATKFKSLFANAMLESGKSAKQLLSIAGGDQGVAANLRSLITDIAKPGGPATIADVLNKPEFLNFVKKYPAAVTTIVTNNRKALQSTLDLITNVDKSSDVIFTATKNASTLAFALAPIPNAVNTAFEHGGSAGINQAQGSIKLLQQQAEQTFRSLIQTGSTAEEAAAKLKELGLPALPPATANAFVTQLDNIKATAEAINNQLDAMPDAFAAAIAAANGVPQNVNVDQAVVDSESIASAIQAAITKGGVAGKAELNQAIAGEASTLGKVLSTAVTSGQITDEASARAFLDPIRQAMIESLSPPDPNDPAQAAKFQASVDEINQIFTDGLANILPTIDVQTATEAANAFLASHPLLPTLPPNWLQLAIQDQLNVFGQGHGLNGAPVPGGVVQGPVRTTAINQGVPSVTNVTIVEAKDPRATARSTIAALRADRLLQHGVR